MSSSVPPVALVVPLTILLSGCVTSRMKTDLAATSAIQQEEFESLLGRARTEPSTSLAWDGAYRRMQEQNLSLRQSRQQLVEAGRATRRQWLGLVPKLGAFANIGSSFSELTNLGGNDLNARLVANFTIPSPFEFYASLYAAALQKQNAEWSHELDKRRAYAQLYSAFSEADSLRQMEAAFEQRKRSFLEDDTADLGKQLKSLASEADSLTRRWLYHRLSVNQLLNSPGSDWRLIGEAPDVSYRNRYKRLKIGEKFGKLALNLQAVQVEGAILRLSRVKFQQWPTISFGLSNPPLYSSDGDNGFSSDDLLLFSGASKYVDLTDLGGRENIRDAETRLKFTREQVRQRIETEVARMLQLSASYDRLLKEETRLKRELSNLARPGTAEPEIVLKDLELRSQLELNLIENRRQIRQLDLQFLIWDETFWNS